ncbi:von Willebrand factor type A [Haloferax mediterranei ATCC 33500]|uniref:von Willebrand factor type A n=1 Tax=Haloferax mediterranei (strain ATCC 33500 / DSM 1411 / JCM 8866 / NBRC 14739 / NCIMB 2177 / R-4) TaxID=523841 RepID=M0J0R9_HALMT|nr:von Willebrand factor type A [Haloferax mediterranei ATCC 33500]
MLGSLGVIGGAAALGGAGTIAGFSDVEEKVGWLEAGKMDLMLDYRATYKPWERFELNPDDPLRDGDYTNGEAVPVDGDDMTFVVGQAPDYRVDDDDNDFANDPAVSAQQWAELTTSVDPCAIQDAGNDPTDLRSLFPNSDFGDVDVFGSPTVDDTYEPGFVDGFQGMQVDLLDIKPLDEGECTVSLHVCDNPAFVWARVDYHPDDDRATADAENTIIEPEMPQDTGSGVWEFGELDDYMWVQLWDDANCNNQLDEDEVVLYQGSFRGLIEEMRDGFLLNPFQSISLSGTVDSTNGTITLDSNQKFTVSGNPQCHNLNDIEVDGTTFAEAGITFEPAHDLDEDGDNSDEMRIEDIPGVGKTKNYPHIDGGTIDVLGIGLDSNGLPTTDPSAAEGGAVGIQFTSTNPVRAVILKGGAQGASAYIGADAGTTTADLDVDVDYNDVGDSNVFDDALGSGLSGDQSILYTAENPNGKPAEISNMSFCLSEDADGNGELPPQEIPLCIDDACIAYEWFLPQELVDDSNDRGGTAGQGFTQLPSDRETVTRADGTTVDVVDVDGDGNITLADEIVRRFQLGSVDNIDINVVQTDSFHFQKEFVAEQCRHHTGETPTNPF